MSTESASAVHALTHGFLQLYPDEAAQALEDLSTDQILRHLAAEPPSVSAEIFVRLNPEVAVAAMAQMEDGLFRGLFSGIDPSRGAALLARMGGEAMSTRLEVLSKPIARELRELMSYPPGSAGSLMDARVTSFRADETVDEAMRRIRPLRQRRITDLCIVDDGGRLTAVVPLQEAASAEPDERLGDLVRKAPVSIRSTSQREEVVELLESSKLASIPVVDFEGRLLGVLRHDGLVAAAQQDATEDLQAMVGAGREERALSKATFAVRKRLPWLQINLGTAFLAAAVVGLFEGTIAKFTALAILLPVVGGQSGNTGAQALAVTMRGLALREIRISNWARVVRKEAFAGFLNGCAVSLVTSLAVYVFMGSPYLALVIGVAMVLSMVSAGLAGAAIPMILTALKQDPAQSASIVLTTVTDVMGFLSFLGFAALLTSMFDIAL